MKDLYKILGVPRTASQDEITAAYRRLVRKYHPDKHQDSALHELAQEKLQELNAAYEVLSNPTLRTQYDASGQTPFGAPPSVHTKVASNFQRFLVWALFVIGTPLAVRFVRNPKVGAIIVILAIWWFIRRWKRNR